MLKQILFQFNPWWEGDYQTNLFPRELYLHLLIKAITRKSIEMITGTRRVGKTALMKMLIEKLLEKVPSNQILYISLDAFGLEKYSIHDILEEFRKIHKHSRDILLYLFLDEVIAKENFQQELKNFYDNENVKIFCSASQAGLLKDRRAFLTGRVRIHEILPLTFQEYLQFKKIEIKESEHYLIEQYFVDYMKAGGIPEYVLTGDIGYLQELADNILYKDIIAANGIKDAMIIRDFFKLLMERAGKQASVTKMANILKISPDTSRRYFNYFQNSYLIHPIERCGKLNERIRSGRKIYAGDVGMRNMITGFRDKGAIFENLIYFKIRKYNPCYFLQNGIEIDFKTDNLLIEAKYNSEMTDKQIELFERSSVKNKILINSVDSFLNFNINEF